VEAQTEIQTYLDQGKQALAQGQAREAAIAYAHGAQIDPDNPMARLGLAEANLALGDNHVVRLACQDVLRLQPDGGAESKTALALLNLLDQRYDDGLKYVDAIIEQDPGIAYVHALRSHLLRSIGQDYDANLARARAARLSFGGRFEGSFPPVTKREPDLPPLYARGYSTPVPPAEAQQAQIEEPARKTPAEQVPTWSRPNGFQRQMVRARFTLSQYPGIITNILIGICVIVFILQNIPGIGATVEAYGVQYNPAILVYGQWWRLFTGMFLHNDIIHIAMNMLSLFFVGRTVEMLYGPIRYLAIYLLSGLAGALTYLFMVPGGAAVGASGAIFGIFGALGVFYFVNRHALGTYGRSAISQWLFWIGINVVIGFSGGIAWQAHLGGLIAGMVISAVLIPYLGRRLRF
jgi:membrane associated rhomboid family serine protease